MQNTASVPTDQFPELLTRLPAGLDLDTLARETKAIQRDLKICGGANLLRLALARGPGGFSLRQSSGWVSLLEIEGARRAAALAGPHVAPGGWHLRQQTRQQRDGLAGPWRAR